MQSFLLQQPSSVQPSWATVFYETPDAKPYRGDLADREISQFQALLGKFGAEICQVTDLLLPSVASDGPRARSGLERLARESVDFGQRTATDLCALGDAALVELVISRPVLELRQDEGLREISPDAATESYRCRPPFGLVFPRDHYVLGRDRIFMGRFRRADRRPETAIVRLALDNLGCRLADPLPPGLHLEGGDVIGDGRVAVVSTGFRTDDAAVRHLLSEGAFDADVVITVPDQVRDPCAFHLDLFALLLGDVLFFHEAYAAAAGGHCAAYRRNGTAFTAGNENLTLEDACRAADLELRLLPPDTERPMMFNALVLPEDKRLVCAAGQVEPAIAQHAKLAGHVLTTVEFGEAHRQYGSLHCAANELPPSHLRGTA